MTTKTVQQVRVCANCEYFRTNIISNRSGRCLNTRQPQRVVTIEYSCQHFGDGKLPSHLRRVPR